MGDQLELIVRFRKLDTSISPLPNPLIEVVENGVRKGQYFLDCSSVENGVHVFEDWIISKESGRGIPRMLVDKAQEVFEELAAEHDLPIRHDIAFSHDKDSADKLRHVYAGRGYEEVEIPKWRARTVVQLCQKYFGQNTNN